MTEHCVTIVKRLHTDHEATAAAASVEDGEGRGCASSIDGSDLVRARRDAEPLELMRGPQDGPTGRRELHPARSSGERRALWR